MRPQRTFPTAQHDNLLCPLHMPLLHHMCMIAALQWLALLIIADHVWLIKYSTNEPES